MPKNILMIVVFLTVGYVVGSKYPGFWRGIVARVTGGGA